METSSLFGAFNARWISPSEVARTFVPLPAFRKLVQTRSSVLMGPRGCGKTTLLKMLTSEAQEEWSARIQEEPNLAGSFSRPDFEAIYIPSDVRWSFELESLVEAMDGDTSLAERLQRALIAVATQVETTKVFDSVLTNHPEPAQQIAVSLIETWHLQDVVPTLSQIRLWLMSIPVRVRNLLVKRATAEIEELLNALPPAFIAHALDSILSSCAIAKEVCGDGLLPTRWALCFDELEIAPPWLQGELLSSLRSVTQGFLLKLTWSPVLPRKLVEDKQEQADFDAIRIWHSHVRDAIGFCHELTTRMIHDRLGNSDLAPSDVLGQSLFAREDSLGEAEDVYAQESDVWQAMVDLASRDETFKRFLRHKGFDPTDPVSDETKARDECLRKIKPIVLLRETFRGADRARSRKRPALYAGEDAVYAMSDGNPRWLAGLVNEILDAAPPELDLSARPLIKPSLQAPLLTASSRRMKTFVRSFPTSAELLRDAPGTTLESLVDSMAKHFQAELLLEDFTDEPSGSFVVDRALHDSTLRQLERGLLIGALIYVGESRLEIPRDIINSRIRLSFMFSPAYRLAFRNYRSVQLSGALKRAKDTRQVELDFDSRNDDEAS